MKKMGFTEFLYRSYPVIILGAVALILIVQLIRSYLGAYEICPECGGDGTVNSKYTYKLRYEIIETSLKNYGDNDPLYDFNIKIKNTDKNAGLFKVDLHFEYSKMNDVILCDSVMIDPDSSRYINIKFDPEYKYDNYIYDVIAPVETVLVESICPQCGGTGKIRKKQFPFNL